MRTVLGLLAVVAVSRAQGPQCSWASPDGNYQIEWEFDPVTLLVTFGIDTRHQYLGNGGQDTWTGLMIGRSMSEGDFLIVDVLNNRNTGAWDVKFRDMRSGGGRASPIPDDPGQDHIVNGEGRVVDGRIYARFSRPLQTSDRGDASLADCGLVFNFPVTGGQLFRNGERLFIGKHTQTPLSLKNICITRDCVKASPLPQTPPPTAPPTRPPPPVTARPQPQPPPRQPQQPPPRQPQLPPPRQPDRPQLQPRPDPNLPSDQMPVLQCTPGQNDHSSCFGYLEEYFQNVTSWAEQNAFEPASQFPRACRLLVQAQNGLIKAVCCKNLSERFCRASSDPFQ